MRPAAASASTVGDKGLAEDLVVEDAANLTDDGVLLWSPVVGRHAG